MEFIVIAAYFVVGAIVWGLGSRVFHYDQDDGAGLAVFGVIWPLGVVVVLVAGFFYALLRLAEWCAGWDS